LPHLSRKKEKRLDCSIERGGGVPLSGKSNFFFVGRKRGKAKTARRGRKEKGGGAAYAPSSRSKRGMKERGRGMKAVVGELEREGPSGVFSDGSGRGGFFLLRQR